MNDEPDTTIDPHDMSASELQHRYDETGSVSGLARSVGIERKDAERLLRMAGIAVRSAGYASPRTVEIKRGPEHHNWKGGIWTHSDGYIYEYAPDHPTATREWPYVLQHRLVMERSLGRFLAPDEDVHHDDEVKTNNVPTNLILTKRSPHLSHHAKKKRRTERGTFA